MTAREQGPEWIAARRREGYGEGEGATYKPWMTVRSFASRGMGVRPFGPSGRAHHLFSTREHKCFVMLHWSDLVTDIREQFPLHELQETQAIAESLGVEHGRSQPRGRAGVVSQPVTMTTDFLVSLRDAPGLPAMLALSVKPSGDLALSPRRVTRLLEKAEIERRYWAARQVPFRLVTDAELPADYIANITLLLGARSLDGIAIPADEVPACLTFLADQLRHAPTVPMSAVCAATDRQLRVPSGQSLALVWHALGTKAWTVDLSERLRGDAPAPASLRFTPSTRDPMRNGLLS